MGQLYKGNTLVMETGGGYVGGNGIVISGGIISSTILTKSSSAPASANEGDLWYDTTNDILKVYDGTNWNGIGSGALSGWKSYDNSSSTPASISLDNKYFNHKITLLGDGSTTTAIAYAAGYSPTPGAKYTFDIINASTTSDALITIFGVQLIVLADNGSGASNIFSFIYDDATSSYKVDVGTMNLLSQDQYNNFTSAKNTDGVFRWILEDE